MKNFKVLFFLIVSVISLGYGALQSRATTPPAPHSLKDLTDLVAQDKIDSIEKLLAELPLDLRKRYHLLHHTGGILYATEEFPRVIMTTDESDLTLSFSTDPNQSAYNELELFEYDKNAKDFNFQSIRFIPGSDPKISEVNPSKCMSCHHNEEANKNHPIWEEAYAWPNAYGSIADLQTFTSPEDSAPVPGKKVEYIYGEKAAYDKYIYPKLESEGLFKYLAKDIYSPITSYMFRTPSESPMSKNFEILNSRAMTDSFVKKTEAKGINVDQFIYPIVTAEICGPDASLYHGPYPPEFTPEELYDFGKTFLTQDTLDRLIAKGSQKMGVAQGANPLATLTNVIQFLKDKEVTAVQKKNLQTCDTLNHLSQKMGVPGIQNCAEPFTEILKGIDPKYSNEIVALNHIDIVTHRLNLKGNLFLALIFKAMDFPYETWSTSGELWRSWTSHNQGASNISYPLLNRPFVATDFPELADYVAKSTYKVFDTNTFYFFSEIANFPAHYSQWDYLKSSGLCDKMAEKSKAGSGKLF